MKENKKLKQDYARLLRISADMAKAITDAYWDAPLRGPTLHMRNSVAEFTNETGIKMHEDQDSL
jgi:hypothetical protein